MIKEEFGTLKKTSFDYEVVERASKIVMLKYDGKWKDLGTWETLTEEMHSNISGLALADELCSNTHIVNEQEIPVIAMGIKNSVIVVSRDGILVAEKGETYRLKEFILNIDKRPMFEEKRWGRYIVIEHTNYENGSEALTKKLYINKGKQISYQYHENRKEIWTIIKGSGVLFLNDEKREVSVGDVIKISEREKHGIQAINDLEMIEVQLGNPLIEEDIIRLQITW